MEKNFNQFAPELNETIYHFFNQQYPVGTNKCHLHLFDDGRTRKKGIFIHSGSKVKIPLIPKEHDEKSLYDREGEIYRIKFSCLLESAVRQKSKNQIFRVLDVNENIIFSFISTQESRCYPAPEFEITVKDSITLEVAPETDADYGWCIFSFIEVKKLYSFDRVEYSQTKMIFDIIDKCNLHCVSCYHGMHGGTGEKMDINDAKTVVRHAMKHLKVNYLCTYNWGEPFLIPNFDQYITEFSKLSGLAIDISSNMNLTMSKEKIARILPHIKALIMSVSGFTNPVYQIYHKGGDINKVFKNIEICLNVKKELQLSTPLVLRYGINRFNQCEKEAMKNYCEERDIIFSPARYYITDMELVDKVLHDERIPEESYLPFYASYEEMRQEILKKLTPFHCDRLYSDVTISTGGNLMTCCAAKIDLGVPITDIMTTEQMVKTRLDHEFCRRCFEEGYSGYLS